ncbi:MAG: 2Fe-2S iron-sulfur cluster binding domain-containing protein [Geobacter sp.]|nr:2Fe-2S iron-sulfur cluster binding domain-containing protein [Geobacter sp.]
MVNLTIDDKQVSVAPEATIYDAAKAVGIRIPILCHDKKLHPFGGCRMCLVEVEQMKGRLIPACTTPVSEGMIVRTMTDEIVKARKLVLELLLLKHPLDCPVCDAAGDCDLQNLTFEYKVEKNHFTDEKFRWEIDYENPLIERDQNRCIHCGKCSRICDEIVSFGAYSFVNRGIEAKIGTPFDEKLDCEYCGSCISVCPVGALLARPFKFKARWWALNKVKSVCSYCGTGCQLTLGVKDDKVLTTVYDEDQGFHNGQLCNRGRFGYQFINSEKRLKTPLIRKNGSLVPASWEEALSLVTAKISEQKSVDASTVAALVTPRLTNEELLLTKKFFNGVVGTDSIDHSAGYAHAALTEGLKESFGITASPSEITDIQKTNLLLVVKSDAYETHPVIGFEINLGVKRKGVDLRIVSDKSGKLTKLPDAKKYIHKPGAELLLVNALAKTIIDAGLADTAAAGFEELKSALATVSIAQAAASTGVSAELISSLAIDYAKAEKALILLPIGLGYPGHGKDLAQALANLAILTGKIGKEGCGILVMGEKNNSQGAADLGIYPSAGGRNAGAIIDGCASGAVKLLYIVGENPVVSYPDRAKTEKALDAVPFLVVQDLFLTETAQMADVVLPAKSFAEKCGTFTSVGRNVQRIRKAIKAVGQSRSDKEIFAELIAGISGAKVVTDAAELFKEIAATTQGYAGLEFDKLTDAGCVYPVALSPRLVPVNAAVPAAEEGKFALLTGSALYHCGTLSLFGEGPMLVCPEQYLELGRSDAAKLGIKDGDTVKVKSAAGELTLAAKVTVRMPEGVVFAPYHFEAASINRVAIGAPVTYVSISK